MEQLATKLKSDFETLNIPTKSEKLLAMLEPLKDKSPSYLTMYNHVKLLGKNITDDVLNEYHVLLADKLEQVEERTEVRYHVDKKLSKMEGNERDRVENAEHQKADDLLNDIKEINRPNM